MRSGITRQALRRHRWSLLGPACTQVVAATIIAAMIDLQHSITGSLSTAGRAMPEVGDVLDSASVFLGDAVYLAIVIVAVTMNLTIGRQLRDIALLRSIGASPAQIRRSVAAQAAATALPASLLGTVLAVPCCSLWLHALTAHDVLPQQVAFAADPVSLAAAAGIVLVTSVIAALLASLRTARLQPATALVEVATGRPAMSRARTIIGAVLMGAGAVLSAVLSTLAPSQMADAGVFVLLAECIGVGLLSPVLLHRAIGILRRLLPGDRVRVAADDLQTLTRALSGALIPLVLCVAFTAIKVAVHTTTAHATGAADPAEARWMDYSGTTIFCLFAAVAALNCLLTIAVGRRRELATMQLAGAERTAVIRMAALQAGIVTLTALLLAGLVAVITLVPLLHSTLQVWLPYFPPGVLAASVVAAAALVAAGIVLPVAILTRHRPVRVLAATA